MRLCFAVPAVLAVLALPAAAQSIDEIKAAAGGTMDMLVCSAFFALEAEVLTQAGGATAAEDSSRRASILVTGAAVLRTSEFGETVEVAMDTAGRHSDGLHAILRQSYVQEGHEKFVQSFNLGERMPYCTDKAKGIAAALQQGLGG